MPNTGSGEAPSSSSGRAGWPPTSSQPPRVPGLLPRGPFPLQVTRPLCCLNEVTPCSAYWAHLHCLELLMFGFIYYIKKKKIIILTYFQKITWVGLNWSLKVPEKEKKKTTRSHPLKGSYVGHMGGSVG